MSATPQKPPQRRWRRRAEARPDEILSAALAEFVERGFDAARMEDIAARAGLSKAGVYLYFQSKEALLEALIDAKVEPITRRLGALALGGVDDPVATLRLILTGAASALGDPAVFAVPRLMIGLSGRFPQIAEHYRTHVVEPALSALEQLVAAGLARGVFRPVEPRAAARAIVGPLLLEALWTHVLNGPNHLADPQQLVANQIDLLLEGLAA